jgi:hypothetical protein
MPARMDDERDTTMERTIAPQSRAIWTERALIALIMGSLAATFNLLLVVHRQAMTTSAPAPPAAVVAQSEPPAVAVIAGPTATIASPSPRSEPVEIAAPREDPTTKMVAGLAQGTAREIEAGRQSDARAVALEAAIDASTTESKKWKRRELLVRQQIAGLTTSAAALELAASTLDAERDVLAHERDALKAAITKAGRRSGFAVLPYKGPNGTWRRPIVLECKAGNVKLQPNGPTFSSLQLSPLINPRSSPLVRAIAQEMLHIQASDTPDGAAAVPYLVFLIRPNGIRPYYEARTCLEPLGIAFGYELIEQDMPVDIPDFDNLATWDGSVPLEMPLEPAPRPKISVAMNSTDSRSARSESSTRAGQQAGGKNGDDDEASPGDFVWPSRGRKSGSGKSRDAASESAIAGGASGGAEMDGSLNQGLSGNTTDFPRHGTREANGPFGNGSRLSGGSGDDGNSPGSSGSSRSPGIGTGLGTRLGGGTGSANQIPATPGSGLKPIGASGSAGTESPDGSGHTMDPIGREAANALAGGDSGASGTVFGGAGGNGTPAGGSGSRTPLAGGSGSAMSRGGGANAGASVSTAGIPGMGSGSSMPRGPGSATESAATSGGGGTDNQGPDPSTTGAAEGATQTLPDLEPAGDGSSASPFKTGTVSTSDGPPIPGPELTSKALAQLQAAAAAAAPAGAGAGAANSQTAGPTGSAGGGRFPRSGAPTSPPGQDQTPASAGSGTDGNASGSTSGAAVSSGRIGAAAVGGSSSLNTSVGSAGGDSSSQPGDGPQGSSLAGSQDATGSSGGSMNASSASPAGQPTLGMNLPGGLTSPSSESSSGFGAPSLSTSQPSTNGSSAGMASDSLSPTSSSSAPSSPSFGQSASAAQDSTSSDDLIFAPPPRQATRPGTIEVPFEIVVVCRQNDILLHPGGYRLTAQAMGQPSAQKDSLLAREIVAMVRKRAIVDPLIRPKPKVKFLVETNGSNTFWTARRQLLFSLPDWPMSLQVPGTQDLHVFTKETW